MKGIGGYFELELHNREHHYHDTPYKMKNGRAALHSKLAFIKPLLVYVPYYTCDSMLEPFAVANVAYRFYEISEKFEPEELPELKAGEYFLHVNYFGVKEAITANLSAKYEDKLIIDATQAFFMNGNGVSWLFNSCRDGAYLYVPTGIEMSVTATKNEKYLTEHLLKRFNGFTQEGYSFFQKNEEMMDCDIVGMSTFSKQLLSGVDYDNVAERRRLNYCILRDAFKGINIFEESCSDQDVPMCYPLLLDKKVDRRKLAEQNIFVPVFWNEVLGRLPDGFDTEKRITEYLLPLPVDHRYTPDDMYHVIKTLANIL